MAAGPCAKFRRMSPAAVASELSAARRWRIVLAHDRRYDGAFVYAVRSTGIYCRPSCARRLSRFTAHLKERKRVSPATYAAGYSSSSRVYERAAAQLGMTPATYARGGRGMVIAFAAVPCPLGTLLVAATPRGICRVSLGHGAPELEAELRGEFPGAEIQRDRGDLGRWVAAILRYLDGREPHLDLPLDIRATAFQRQVWEALRKIPYGRTRSYAEVARAIGRPRATRAVARACASNPAALVIPCHRVVKSNGDLGGYRWGMERKQALLRQESGNRPGNN